VLVNRGNRYNNSIIRGRVIANMSMREEDSPSHRPKRWYDNDPALKNALDQLRNSSDQHQAQIALNIIKIIVEHQMEAETAIHVEDLNRALPLAPSQEAQSQRRRWYDVHETLSSAIQLLLDSPPDLQQRLIPSLVQMIESTLDAPAA
jgi:hypothetical protein